MEALLSKLWFFTPQALRTVWVFFHPWCLDGWASGQALGWQEKVFQAVSQKLKLVETLVGVVGVQRHGVTLI